MPSKMINIFTKDINFLDVIRDIDVEVFADNFTEDTSVGIPFGFDNIWAKTLDGKDFELTEKEQESLSIIATDLILDIE